MIIPMLTCRDAATEIKFCQDAFGATLRSERKSPDGTTTHATLAIGAALLMVHGEVAQLNSRQPQPDGSSSVVIYLYVADTDRTVQRALQSGATILLPVADQAWGDRVGRIMDPAGHVWNIATHRAAKSDAV
jgi:PhnB protein